MVVPLVPLPAVVPDVAPGCVLLVPDDMPLVAGVEPGCTMAPPLAPSVPPVVAPGPVTEFWVDVEPLVLADAPDPRVELLDEVCATAPPAIREATRRPRSLLML
jgi:hypothetical protein